MIDPIENDIQEAITQTIQWCRAMESTIPPEERGTIAESIWPLHELSDLWRTILETRSERPIPDEFWQATHAILANATATVATCVLDRAERFGHSVHTEQLAATIAAMRDAARNRLL